MKLLFALLALVLTLAPARADDLRPGYLEWAEQSPGQWRVMWKAPLLGGLATRTKPILPSGCTVRDARRQFVGQTVVETFHVRCAAPLAGRSLGLAGLESGFADALLRVAPLQQPAQAVRLTPQGSEVVVASRGSASEVGWTYLRLGFSHILFGFDHLLFVVALVLLIGGWRRLFASVTAFTVAHSLTLAATTLGLVSVARKPVEICIALSIVLVAREILRSPDVQPTPDPVSTGDAHRDGADLCPVQGARSERWSSIVTDEQRSSGPKAARPEGVDGHRRSRLGLTRRAPALIAFAFGLLHGFGFAAALAEIGLPAGEIPLALFTFNIGVELGQLVIVAATLALLVALARLAAELQRPATVAGAYAIGAVASGWVIARALA